MYPTPVPTYVWVSNIYYLTKIPVPWSTSNSKGHITDGNSNACTNIYFKLFLIGTLSLDF